MWGGRRTLGRRRQRFDEGSRCSPRDRNLVVATLALLLVPVALDLGVSGPHRVYGYLAIDFFYYETVAGNYVELGFATFDRERPTNGFHPLWQYTLIGLALLWQAIDGSAGAFLLAVLALCAALVAASVVLIARTQRLTEGRVSILLPWVVPGAFALLTGPLYRPAYDFVGFRVAGGERPFVGTLWRYLNGMETGLVLCTFFASLLLLARLMESAPDSRRRRWLALACGAVLGLLALSRLDHAIFSVTLPLALLIGRSRQPSAIRAAAGVWAVVAAMIGTYIALNLLRYGIPLPVSGAVKSSFPRITVDNLHDLVALVRGERSVWVPDAWRLAQQLLPPSIAGLYLAVTLRRGGRRVRSEMTHFDRALVATVPGVLAISAYDFLFVRSNSQGHWYLPVSVTLCSVYLMRLAGRHGMEDRLESTRGRRRVAIALALVSGGMLFSWAHYRPRLNQEIAEFRTLEAPRIRAAYSEPPKVIEFYDALFASSTRFPTVNGFGLAADREMAAAGEAGASAIFELALARGFDRVVSFHFDGRRLPLRPTRLELVALLDRYVGPDALAAYDLELEYRSADGRHVVLRVMEASRTPP